MKISLIVATKNRNKELTRLFDSLSNQTYNNFEIILVDQSNPEEFILNESTAKKYNSRLTIHHIKDDGVGLSRARNIGLKKITGQIVGFPDDDCWYHPEITSIVYDFLKKNKEVQFICGRYTEPDKIEHGKLNSDITISHKNARGSGSSVSIFIRKEVFDNHQIKFDEKIGAGTPLPIGEETDLLFRIALLGKPGMRLKNLVVYHKLPDLNAITKDQKIRMEIANGYIMGKNLKTLFVLKTTLLGIIKISLTSSPLISPILITSRIRGVIKGIIETIKDTNEKSTQIN